MKKTLSFLLAACLCISFTTGCAAVQVRDRSYLQALELSNPENPTVSLHDFIQSGEVTTGEGASTELALRSAAVPLGKELFLGHLELVAYSAPYFTKELASLMDTYRLSPACKVLGLPADTSLKGTDTSALVEQLRKQEQNGTLPETNLFTVLRELSAPAGTALLPIPSSEGFSLAILSEDQALGTLSKETALGLCWLRGDNLPQQVETAQAPFSISSAFSRLHAVSDGDRAEITISVYLRGEGDFQQAANTIESQCQSAIEETVIQLKSDVFDWHACLQSQCHRFTETYAWEEILERTAFRVTVVPLDPF